MGYIYKITNKINNQVYIGQTIKTTQKRWSQHVKEAQEAFDGKRRSFPYFHRAIIKYGTENFLVETLEECADNVLDEREKYWISHFDSYNNGYNSTLGGQNSDEKDFPIKSTGRKVIQYSLDGEFLQIYEKASIAAKAVGVDDSRIRDACNQKNKTSGGFQWRWYEDNYSQEIESTDSNNRLGRKVVQYDLDGKQLCIYNSITEAAKTNNYNYQNIFRVVSQNKGKAYGYYWSYIENTPLIKNNTKEEKVYSKSKTDLPVIQYTKAGDFIKKYASIKQAATELGIKPTSIVYVCDGKFKTTHGFHWEYDKI